ncbi:PhzF family phenazine biosynthesis protein [Thalassospira indica]|uniref:PhzF family phenazine biosynthesis protein n=1 Tax=Thalassospira indica TaxID=1891279 RepID=A0ABM6Y4H1_9PROT|nr:PhzF family phenazine biosynthesis protein [Thalassospira indica]AXO16854.1 PhzF family phenazine biosynthesis protein [Thalassospira indica]OAZ12749.1 isomerase [Thalassospira profundimaris]
MTSQTLPIYQIDAFTDVLFAGNPAAVVPLSDWLPDDVLQKIAMENNLSETAFFVPSAGGDANFHIRWFTPTVEVPLCGHATLASAFVIFNRLGFEGDLIKLQSKSGILTARREGDAIVLNFPKQPIKTDVVSKEVLNALGGAEPIETFGVVSRDTDIVLVYRDASIVRNMRPDMSALAKLADRGVIVTAPGDKTGLDMVSRYFLPALGINEDPVTGYMHCVVGPYWAENLGKADVVGYQASARGGVVVCKIDGDRVHLKGEAFQYLKGEIVVPA